MSLLATLLIGAGLLAPAPRIIQAPQGTTDCNAVTYWFADAFTRVESRKQPQVLALLTLYNGQATTQTAKITARGETAGVPFSNVTVIPVPSLKRLQFDLTQLTVVGSSGADFSVEVECERICAAALRMEGSVTVASPGLPLCR